MRPSVAQTDACLTQIQQLTTRLRTLEQNLRRRAEDTALDGYPQSAAGHGTSSGTSDPVGAVVALRLDDPRTDPIQHAHTQLVTKLDHARRILEQAESDGQQALPPPPPTIDDGCRSCARIKTWAPIHRTHRCRWCSDWAYNHNGEDPPPEILRAHHEGRRITEHTVKTLTHRGRR